MDANNQIQTYTQGFISHLFPTLEFDVKTHQDESTNTHQILITTNHPAQIIGYHGETLSAIQIFLSIHLKSVLGENITISVNVNDYKERRQSSIESLAQATVAKVLTTGRPHTLPPMSPSERRLIHLYLSEHPQVVTTSQGEGRDRSVVISLKSPAN